ncbi:MAG TPA: hypothetical protein VNQ76_09775 [Planctomicrobium sp.]|nr:hypothetical protein [Planctomicrobium sp.]
MATLTDYKGLDVVEDATGDGGIALTDNFKELADRAPYQAGANPGVNDDSTKGFSPGDQWLNTSTQVLWACVSNSTGAAVWKSIFKRTVDALELIPEETAEKVQVSGGLEVHGSASFAAATFADNVTIQNANPLFLYLIRSAPGIVGIIMQSSQSHVRISKPGGTVTACSMGINGGGDEYFAMYGGSSSELRVKSGAKIGWSSHATNTTQGADDTYFERLSAGVIGTNSKIDSDADAIRVRSSNTPASASATGNQGDICWDDDYVYVCVATDTWKRSALTTW